MLSNSNDSRLRQKNVDNKYIFFFQRWQELLESRTLDMYQYNILNTYVACVELIDVIEKTMSGLLTSRINVDDCKDEALSIVKCDEILEKHNRPLRNLLLRILGSKIDGKTRGDILDDKNGAQYISLNRLKFQLQTPVRQLEQHYLSYVLEELKASIDAQDKAKTEICMKALISQCISMGWSTKGLFLLSELFEGEKSELEKWTAFKNRITTDGNTFFEIYLVETSFRITHC